MQAVTHVYYVAITFGYWGRGSSEQAAIKACRKAGWNGKHDRLIIYRNCYEGIYKSAEEDKPTVNSYGMIFFNGRISKIAVYEKGARSKRREIVE